MNIVRCDFRGEPVSTIELKNLPAEYADFTPNRIVVRGASLYLADTKNMKVIVTDDAGVFKNGHDIASLMMGGFDGGDKEKNDYEMTGFSVDKEGNILFTNSSMGRAFKLNSENGQLRFFGRRGSSPGKFGVPTDIVADATGKYILVSDILRCVVMIFDNDFKFYSEFGFRGYQPSNLIGPMFMTVDSKNRVYVSQLRNRGINVYQLSGS
jgi:DNA-binding beta-propeller fold protein YncE